MKKVISLLTLAVVGVSLTACGESPANSTPPAPAPVHKQARSDYIHTDLGWSGDTYEIKTKNGSTCMVATRDKAMAISCDWTK